MLFGVRVRAAAAGCADCCACSGGFEALRRWIQLKFVIAAGVVASQLLERSNACYCPTAITAGAPVPNGGDYASDGSSTTSAVIASAATAAIDDVDVVNDAGLNDAMASAAADARKLTGAPCPQSSSPLFVRDGASAGAVATAASPAFRASSELYSVARAASANGDVRTAVGADGRSEITFTGGETSRLPPPSNY